MAQENDTVIREFILLGLSSDPNMQIMLFVIFLIMYLIILVANSLIILVTVTDSTLQTPMYFLLTNLSILDILYSSSVIPRMLIDLLVVNNTILFADCIAQMYISLSLGETECILLAIMAYDRYIAICFPLHYAAVVHRTLCIKIAIGMWISGFLLSISHVVLTWNVDLCGNNVINHYVCEVPEILALGCGNVNIVEFVIFIVGVIILIVPICSIIIIYVKIINAIFKISSSTGRKKAFSTCGSHILVVTLFYGSAMVTYMKPRSQSSPDTDKLYAIFYLIVAPMLNPLIYTLRNKEVKSALKKVSCMDIKKSFMYGYN